MSAPVCSGGVTRVWIDRPTLALNKAGAEPVLPVYRVMLPGQGRRVVRAHTVDWIGCTRAVYDPNAEVPEMAGQAIVWIETHAPVSIDRDVPDRTVMELPGR